MAENRDELIEYYRQARRELLAVLEGLTDEQMTERSLDGWSVKDHLAHLAVWDEVRASEVTRISAGHDSAWRMTGEQDAAYNTLTYALRVDTSLDQVRWELETSRQRLLDAIADATPHGLAAARYGEAGLRSLHEAEHTGWIKRWRGEQGT